MAVTLLIDKKPTLPFGGRDAIWFLPDIMEEKPVRAPQTLYQNVCLKANLLAQYDKFKPS